MHKTVHQHKISNFLKKITGLILLLLIAAVFLFSGISKLFAFEQLLWNIMDVGISNMLVAGIIARLLIAAELVIGCFLLLHLYLRQITFPAVIGFLIFFTIYLLFLINTQGNSGNCGCFGETYKMTPLEGILKNVLLLGLTAITWHLYPTRTYKNGIYVALFTVMLGIMTPFVAIPLSSQNNPEITDEPINLSAIYQQPNPPKIDLKKGKHIIAFMSLSCPHCKKAAFLFHIIHKQHPEIPILMILAGSDQYEKDFFDETKAHSVPYVRFKDMDAFMQYAHEGVPAIFYINNSVIERKANYFQLDPNYMQKWLQQ
jgi:uncharacterized membrane protein YphA (DoxX/SURF4 family)/glutaredoxin